MKFAKILCVAFLILVKPLAGAYELATHAVITYKAYLKSNLTLGGTLAKDLGIEVMAVDPDTSDKPFGENYYDSTGSADRTRTDWNFEDAIIGPPRGFGVHPLSVPGWLMRGAIREDDGGYLLGNVYRLGLAEEPYDDPYDNINRWCNHFFDPFHAGNGIDGAATFACPISVHESAVNWAIGTADAFAPTVEEKAGRRNHFTVFDAREAMYRALTGKRASGLPAGPDYGPATEDVRRQYWATLFRALGDILHLNQDMAQPQHTRDESHGGVAASLGLDRGGPSVYEKYVDARAKGGTAWPIDGTPGDRLAPLRYDGYDIPAFRRYSDFWSTGTGPASLGGRGMADYSNHGFFTTDNNINGGKYPLPSPLAASYLTEQTTYPEGMAGRYIMTYLRGSVIDFNKGNQSSPDSIRMVRESVWKDFSAAAPLYTMDRNNFDDMADLLVPRAVGYSAGLINHFFRGRMKIGLPDERVYSLVDHSTIDIADPVHEFRGFSKIKLKLANITPGGETMPFGKLTAVLKFHRNTCYTDNLDGYPPFADWDSCRSGIEEIVVSDTAVLDGHVALTDTPQPFEFNFSNALPLNATDVRLQVVYRGKLGEEDDAVVAATQDISEPTFFSYLNATDYIHIGNTVYTRDQVNTVPGVIGQVAPQSLVDNTLSPPRLRPDSLQPFLISLDLQLDDQGRTKVHVDDLRAGQFIRVAFLGEAPLLPSDRTPIPTSISDLIGQCLPNDFVVDPMEWQTTFDPSTNTLMTWHPRFEKIRGVAGFYATSCVHNGDGAQPGTPDDRNQRMMAAAYDAPSPVPVQINDGLGF